MNKESREEIRTLDLQINALERSKLERVWEEKHKSGGTISGNEQAAAMAAEEMDYKIRQIWLQREEVRIKSEN